jgi:hypothetical protein
MRRYESYTIEGTTSSVDCLDHNIAGILQHLHDIDAQDIRETITSVPGHADNKYRPIHTYHVRWWVWKEDI